MENIEYNKDIGEIYTDRTWTYKIIGAKDIPADFRVFFRRNRPNPVGILGSKGNKCFYFHSVLQVMNLCILKYNSHSLYKTNSMIDYKTLIIYPMCSPDVGQIVILLRQRTCPSVVQLVI